MSQSSRDSFHEKEPPPPYTAPPSYTEVVNERTPLFQRQDGDEDLESSSQSRHSLKQEEREVIRWIPFLLFIFCVFLFLSSFLLVFPFSETPTVHIAIIGAGPAGVSTAFTLAQSFQDNKKAHAKITIFDQSSQIGGRMVLEPSTDFGVQLHAEDLANGCLGQNRVLKKRAKDQIGQTFGMRGGRKDDVAFWDGDGIRSALVRPRGKIGPGLWIKLVWKYGASFSKARDLPKGTLKMWESFLGLGKLTGRVFVGMEEWIREAKMSGAVGLSAKERLSKNGIGGKYVADVLRSELRRQTGGEVEEMSDLALSLALEREDRGICVDGQGGRMVDVLEQFLDQSKAEVRLDTEVTDLKRDSVKNKYSGWILELAIPSQDEKSYEHFDQVIIAAPWNISSILSPRKVETEEQIMRNISSSIPPQEVETEEQIIQEIIYHPLWVTLISSTTKLDRTKLGSGTGSLPHQISQIVPIQNIASQYLKDIHEITYLRDIYHTSPPSLLTTTYLYRIFSSFPPPLELWGDSVAEMYQTKMENAYPVLYPRTDDLGVFKIGEELWWTGAMEAIASEVDGAWVAGENVAEMVRRDIEGKV